MLAFMHKVKLSFLLIVSIILTTNVGFSQKNIEKGMEALSNKNYGLANDYFRKGLKKSAAIAYYGLSKLYVTNDYRNLDSAYRFVLKSESLWFYVPEKQMLAWKSDFSMDINAIYSQKEYVSQQVFNEIQSNPSVASWNQFIENHPFFLSKNTAIYLRDQLAFELAKKQNTSIALKLYMDSLPESSFVPQAQHLYYDLEFAEMTADGKLASFVRFYENCPSNTHLMEAAKEIYRLATINHTLEEYVQFVRTYKTNPYENEAWRNVYKIYLKEYSEEKYAAFQKEFPEYPFMQELSVDIDLFQMKLYPIISNGNYGYMNAQGKLIIPAIYSEVAPFQDGLAVVSKDELFGIIDKKNQVVVDFQYDEVSEFTSNRAIVRKGEKYGVINRSGKLIFPLEFEDISLVAKNSYAVVQDGKSKTYNSNFQEALFGAGNNVELNFSKRMSMKHPEFELVGELDQKSNRAVVKVAGQLNYIDSLGKVILTAPLEWFPDALNVAKYTNGFAVFRKKEKFGLIDVYGKVIQKPIYESSGPYTGFWPVKDKGNWALLDVKGKVVLPFEYNFIRWMPDLGYLIEKGEKLGVLNSAGKMILPVSFGTIKSFESEYFIVSNDEKFGLFLRDGKEVLPMQYERIQRFDAESLVLMQEGLLVYFFPNTHAFISLTE
jgi:hypothetical protein